MFNVEPIRRREMGACWSKRSDSEISEDLFSGTEAELDLQQAEQSEQVSHRKLWCYSQSDGHVCVSWVTWE